MSATATLMLALHTPLRLLPREAAGLRSDLMTLVDHSPDYEVDIAVKVLPRAVALIGTIYPVQENTHAASS